MVRWMRWHSPRDTGYEIRALAVWGRARYLSFTEAPNNIESLRVSREETFSFFETWRPEWGSNPRLALDFKIFGGTYPRSPDPLIIFKNRRFPPPRPLFQTRLAVPGSATEGGYYCLIVCVAGPRTSCWLGKLDSPDFELWRILPWTHGVVMETNHIIHHHDVILITFTRGGYHRQLHPRA